MRTSLFAWLDTCTTLSPAARYAFLRLQSLGACKGVPLSSDDPRDRVAVLLPDCWARLVYEQHGLAGAWRELLESRFVYAAEVREVLGEPVAAWWAIGLMNPEQLAVPTLARYRRYAEPPG